MGSLHKGENIVITTNTVCSKGLRPLEFLSDKEFNSTGKTKFRQPLVTSFTF